VLYQVGDVQAAKVRIRHSANGIEAPSREGVSCMVRAGAQRIAEALASFATDPGIPLAKASSLRASARAVSQHAQHDGAAAHYQAGPHEWRAARMHVSGRPALQPHTSILASAPARRIMALDSLSRRLIP
jgi:hypothetical protein